MKLILNKNYTRRQFAPQYIQPDWQNTKLLQFVCVGDKEGKIKSSLPWTELFFVVIVLCENNKINIFHSYGRDLP